MSQHLPWIFLSTFLVVLFGGITGCSLFFPDEGERRYSISQIDITLVRGALEGEEFENYTASRGKLFRECGRMRSGRYYPAYQNITPLKRQYVYPFLQSADDLIDALNDSPSWAKPGNLGGGLGDPGIIRVKIRAEEGVYSIDTSVDGVANPSSVAEKRLKRVIEVLRGASGKICQNKTFYGLQFYSP
jgi:hypothetical protein